LKSMLDGCDAESKKTRVWPGLAAAEATCRTRLLAAVKFTPSKTTSVAV
jgi:hypothetical protein